MKGYTLSPPTTYPFAVNSLLAVSQILMIFFGGKMTTRFKVQGMFVTGAVLVIALPFLAHLIPSVAGKYWAVFFILFIYGPVNGIVQGTAFQLAAPLPSAYVGAIMLGNGVSGVGSTLLEMLLVAVLPGGENLYTQSLIFFSCATVVLLLSAAVYPFVMNSEFYKYYTEGQNDQGA